MYQSKEIPFKPLSFMSTEHILDCVRTLHSAYERAKSEMTFSKFQSNKVDGLKLTLDALFNGMREDEVLTAEIQRQIDKSINNAIGTFHEQLMGGLPGITYYSVGHGYDIKSDDDTIFGEIKNKHNTMNSSSSKATFEKLAGFADRYPNSTAYLIQIIAKESVDDLWVTGGKNSQYHPRVRIISADRFYAKVTGIDDAFYQLCTFIPHVVRYYLEGVRQVQHPADTTLIAELNERADYYKLRFMDQLLYDTFETYNGFKERL